MANPFYQQKDFRTEKLAALQGLMSDRRANRVLNRYMKSEAGQQAEADFARAESQKYLASVDAFIDAGKKRREGMHQAALQNINASLATRQPADVTGEQNTNVNSNPTLVSRKQPQSNPVSKTTPAPAPATVPAPAPAAPVSAPEATPAPVSEPAPAQPVQAAPVTPQFNLSSFAKAAGLTESRVFDGRTFYRYDPDGVGDFWISEDGNIFNASIGGGLGRMRSGTIDASSMPNYERLVQALNAAKSGQAISRLGRLAKGGSLNRINYFQQGGAAPKQDVKAQVVALVQAAMKGDKKAQQQVEQILKSAKAGKQEMIPLAQMITEVAEQLQGQAVAAKWGAKLDYIHTLKCGGKTRKKKQHGGKFCPSCK